MIKTIIEFFTACPLGDFIIQFLATTGLFVGIYLTGNHRLSGPFITAIAECFTVTVGILHETWSIIVIGIVLFVLQTRNFIKWYRDGIPW